MSEYAQRFAENHIDLSVLPDLTDRDLEELGVRLGARRRMLRAIRYPGNVSVAATAPSMPAATEPMRQDNPERRQLTITLETTPTPLIGRDQEIDLLLGRWDQAKRDGGCVVLISGEPGIGKSRVAQTIVERLTSESQTHLRYFCSPHHQ